MEHATEKLIEHTVGVYLVLLAVACLIGVVVKRLTHVPYTIALVLVGLGLAFFHVGPDVEEAGFSKSLIFFVLLPPLLFQGALHMELDRLRRHWPAVAAFATIGVVAGTLLIGGALHLLRVDRLPDQLAAVRPHRP
jgi:CPA1 family monovalent cation:H+ antiporter